jgi:type I restriction enzyme S subunit
MTDKIKLRIEQISHGVVPEGYKKTKVGVVPQEWKIKSVGNFLKESRIQGTNGAIAKKSP